MSGGNGVTERRYGRGEEIVKRCGKDCQAAEKFSSVTCRSSKLSGANSIAQSTQSLEGYAGRTLSRLGLSI